MTGTIEDKAREVLADTFGEKVMIAPTDFIAKVVAGTYGHQPCMSGDQRDRLNPSQRRAVNDVAEMLHAAMLSFRNAALDEAAEVAWSLVEPAHKADFTTYVWVRKIHEDILALQDNPSQSPRKDGVDG